MRKRTVKRTIPVSFRNRVAFLLLVLLLNPQFLPITLASANPVAVEKDDGNNMGPMPYGNSSIYLARERILVELDDHADVSASYTFKNEGENATVIGILLPFHSRPRKLELSQDGDPLQFNTTAIPPLPEGIPEEDRQHYEEKWNQYFSIRFNISLEAGEETTVLASYRRDYERDDGSEKVYCSFAYVIWTGRLWFHDIELAEFIFTMPKSRVLSLPEVQGRSVRIEDGMYIITYRYENWNVSADKDGHVEFHWREELPWYKRLLPNSSLLRLMFCSVCLSSLLILPVVAAVRVRRRKQQSIEQEIVI